MWSEVNQAVLDYENRESTPKLAKLPEAFTVGSERTGPEKSEILQNDRPQQGHHWGPQVETVIHMDTFEYFFVLFMNSQWLDVKYKSI